MPRSATNQLPAGVVYMIVASEPWDWGTLTPELLAQLVPFLPLEVKDLISSPDTPSVHDLGPIHTRLEHLWRSISAMAPRWILDSVGDPLSTCRCAAEATLLFADVTGFTPLTAQFETFGRIGNEHITNVLNRFFAAVVPIALARNGDLLSFGGDAILVAFDGPHHASAAAVAAWEMQQAMKSLDLDDVGLPDPPRLQMKIGLASGWRHWRTRRAASHVLRLP
jgi:Adenylate and Guanylate cyclase catalytic domain